MTRRGFVQALTGFLAGAAETRAPSPPAAVPAVVPAVVPALRSAPVVFRSVTTTSVDTFFTTVPLWTRMAAKVDGHYSTRSDLTINADVGVARGGRA